MDKNLFPWRVLVVNKKPIMQSTCGITMADVWLHLERKNGNILVSVPTPLGIMANMSMLPSFITKKSKRMQYQHCVLDKYQHINNCEN